jgi:hypothetical protein
VENPPLAKGDEGGFSDREDMEIFMIDKISPNPSLLKRGIREELISRCIRKISEEPLLFYIFL